ncbi:hydrogenase formation protein HypD [Parabacteroides pacaensis]|uniref:hydrogenase formation protein HypD n=1 Tax=Parabacteroides pacaensis TaxID=2086575 RepID=UPI001F29DCC3|nr:hydrogenase formation protein HypD [Parabacteroides pacaensis]
MKYIEEYRNNDQVQTLFHAIRKTVKHPWYLMEICGGQTHAIARYRLEELLPPEIRLLHGPGCPVCVTPVEIIDCALRLASEPGILLASFGDMMRVPGSRDDLLRIKACGGEVRMLYSPLDAVTLAGKYPEKEVVFFAIGFETTVPVHLMALKEAICRGLSNFTLLTAFFTVPPAIETILSDQENKVNGFLTAGHVCAITGNIPYQRLTEKYKIPMVVTGFEPVDLLYGIYRCVCQLEKGAYRVENAYKRVVPERGNPAARAIMEEMLEPCDQEWRGIGILSDSGLKLKKEFESYSAKVKFASLFKEKKETSDKNIFQPEGAVIPFRETITSFPIPSSQENIVSLQNAAVSFSHQATASPHSCIAGKIMRGLKQPSDCPHFGTICQPAHPIGAPMVSSEGVCSAYYKYRV